MVRGLRDAIEKCDVAAYRKRVRVVMIAIEKWYYQFANEVDEDAWNDVYWREVAKIKGCKAGNEALMANVKELQDAAARLQALADSTEASAKDD